MELARWYYKNRVFENGIIYLKNFYERSEISHRGLILRPLPTLPDLLRHPEHRLPLLLLLQVPLALFKEREERKEDLDCRPKQPPLSPSSSRKWPSRSQRPPRRRRSRWFRWTGNDATPARRRWAYWATNASASSCSATVTGCLRITSASSTSRRGG